MLFLLIILNIIIFLILKDYRKDPIDVLYFRNPIRVLVGIQNSLIDIFFHKDYYNIKDYKNLVILNDNWENIQNDYKDNYEKLKKRYFHDLDEWFEKNDNYYYYKCKDFEYTRNLLKSVPSINLESAIFAVMNGKYNMPKHKAETNYFLRYQLTIINTSNEASWLDMEGKKYYHNEGDEILFDHSRAHSVCKNNDGLRVVLIADLNRFI